MTAHRSKRPIAHAHRAALRVLVAARDADLARRAIGALERAFDVAFERAETAAALQRALAERAWDAVLYDPASAGRGSRQTLAALRDRGGGPIVVVLSGQDEERLARELLSTGAHAALNAATIERLVPVIARRLARVRTERLHDLEVLVHSSPDPMLIVSADGRIVHVNALLEQLLGHSRAQLAGQPVELLLPEAARSGHALKRERYFAAPYARPMGVARELVARHKDGSEIPVDISLGPVQVGEETLVCCGVRDLRERRRAERQLRAILEGTAGETGEPFLQALVKNLAAALEVRYAFASEFPPPGGSAARVLAFWDGEKHVPPFDYALAGTPCEALAQGSEFIALSAIRTRFPRDDRLEALGADSFFGIQLSSASGAPIGVLAIVDVKPLANEATARAVLRIFAARAGAELERMRMTAALRASEERFERIFLEAPEHMALVRASDATFIDVNHAFERATGWRREEALGRSSIDLGLWAEPEKREDLLEALSRDRRVSNFEVALRRRDGAIRDHLVDGNVVEIDHERCYLFILRDVTERRRAEKALRQSEERFRATFEGASVGMALRGLDGRWVDVNPKLCEILGYSRAELLGRTSVELTPADDRVIAMDFNARMERGELTSYTREKRYVRKDGTQVWVNQSVSTIRDAAGGPTQLITVVEDISERKKAEHALRENERLLDTLMRNLPGMAYRCRNDPQWTMEYASNGCLDLTGHAPQDLVGNRRLCYADIIHPDDREPVWRDVQEALAGRRPFELRYRIRAADGATKWVWERGRGVFAEGGGELVALEGYIADVTDRVIAEQALRESEAQLRLVADNLPAMICYIGEDFRYRYANRRYAEFYTGAPVSLEGRALEEVLGSETWPLVRPQLERALAGETVDYQARRRRRADGSLRNVDVSLVPHRDGSGRVVGIYTLILDVTRRRRVEEALNLRNRALDSSVSAVLITRPADSGHRIVYVNPAFERITGYTAAEALDRNPRFLHGDDRFQPGLETLRAAAREGREATALVRNYRKDGTLFWNELRVAPVRDDAGRVTHFIGVATDVTDRVRYQEEIERHANYDSLTGLPNRNLLNDRLTQALVKSARSRRPVAVLYLDLDHVKRINDSMGHAMGDQVIAAVGARLAGTVRTGDTVARLGGDEFVIVLADLKREDDAALVAGKLLDCIRAPLEIGAHEFVLSASVGVALYAKDGGDAATLLRNADTALYRAKEEGRDCYRFFAAEMNERVVQFLRLERDLRRALEAKEFWLQYQPIVRLATGRTVGAEALIRWRRSDGTVVSPAQFIPIAEESGLIVPIGRWVLDTAARQAAAWNRKRRTPLFVSVNLSARQFRDPKLVDTVRAILEAADLAPALLKLEITETAVMQDVKETERWLGALKDLGVRLSIDDFGTGYSSLAYLKRFPIDTLKIDRSFVRDLPGDRDDLAISRAVIDLARRLELQVVAEGIETPEQREILAAHGCDMAQGYLFGKPADPEDFTAAILRGGGESWRPGPTPTSSTLKRTRRTSRR